VELETPLRVVNGVAKRYKKGKKGNVWAAESSVKIKTSYGEDRAPTCLAIPLLSQSAGVAGKQVVGAMCVALNVAGRDVSKASRATPLDDEECRFMINLSAKLGPAVELTRKRKCLRLIELLPKDINATHDDVFDATMSALCRTVPHAMHYLVKVDEVGRQEEICYDKEVIEGTGSFNKWGFSVSQLDLYMKAFRLFDDDQSGNISTDELGAVLRGIGKKVSEKQVAQLVQQFDKDESGTLEWKEFLDLNAALEERRVKARERKQRDQERALEQAPYSLPSPLLAALLRLWFSCRHLTPFHHTCNPSTPLHPACLPACLPAAEARQPAESALLLCSLYLAGAPCS